KTQFFRHLPQNLLFVWVKFAISHRQVDQINQQHLHQVRTATAVVFEIAQHIIEIKDGLRSDLKQTDGFTLVICAQTHFFHQGFCQFYFRFGYPPIRFGDVSQQHEQRVEKTGLYCLQLFRRYRSEEHTSELQSRENL